MFNVVNIFTADVISPLSVLHVMYTPPCQHSLFHGCASDISVHNTCGYICMYIVGIKTDGIILCPFDLKSTGRCY